MSRDHRDDQPAGVSGRLALFPVYRDNPFLNLMLLAPRAAGWRVSESSKLEHLERDVASFGHGDVLHLHWTAPIVQRAETSDEAAERLDRFERLVDDARARGVTVLWTVHNALPHDHRHHALEIRLHRYLAANADIVHVLNSRTAEVVADDYRLRRDSIVHIPHPSYRGVYETGLSREAARTHFGLEDDETAVLFFGQIRPYKGVDVLIEALAKARGTHRFALLLAGRTTPEDEAVIDGLLPPTLRVIRHHDYVEDAEVERWFRSADVAVLPYRRILNSGSLHLAATFGVPTVLPAETHLLADFGDETWAHWFAPGDADDLARVLSRPAPGRGGSRDFADRLSPYDVSRRYAALLATTTSADR